MVPLGFWAGNRYVRLDITKHVINMWVAAGILLIVVGLAARKRALIPKGSSRTSSRCWSLFVRDEIAVKNIGAKEGPTATPPTSLASSSSSSS